MKKYDHLREIMDERDKRYEQRYDAQTKMVETALAASKEAVLKAENATEKRFEGVNEFRGALQDASNKLISRVEVEAWREQSRDTQASLSSRLQLIEGRSQGLNAGWIYLAGFISIAAGITAIVISILHR